MEVDPLTASNVLLPREDYHRNALNVNQTTTWMLVKFVRFACIIVQPVQEVQPIVAHAKHLLHFVKMIYPKDAHV